MKDLGGSKEIHEVLKDVDEEMIKPVHVFSRRTSYTLFFLSNSIQFCHLKKESTFFVNNSPVVLF